MLEAFNRYILGSALPAVLVASGIFLSFRLKFFMLLHPVKLIGALTRRRGDGVSPFKAVTTALAGTLGVGNIAGVATAVTAGGAGAVFWMWVSALVAMIIKYGEITLAVLYRRKNGEGWRGGSAYYISDGLRMKRTAACFAVMTLLASFSLGCVIQVRAASDAAREVFGIPGVVTGISIALLTVAVTAGGAARLSEVTVRLIPLLSAVYIVFSMYIITANSALLPEILSDIVTGAFGEESARAASGGVGGFLLSRALRFGTSRGLFSNEAGCGTAPTAHAGADTDSPAAQGCWGIFEVFADTLLLCSMTAFVILILQKSSGFAGLDGIALAIRAYSGGLGSFAGTFIGGSVFFFAFASVLCWSYYGAEALVFLGRGRLSAAYLALYALAAVLAPYIPEALSWNVSELCVGVMTIVNTLCVCALSGELSRETARLTRPPGV